MPRRFLFPDVNDRTVNSPVFLVRPEQVLGYYNQETKEKEVRVTDAVKRWYLFEVKRQGWDSAKFLGNQCLLEAKTLVAA